MATFTLQVPDEVLADLQARLDRTRWPGPFPEPGWRYGMDFDYLREVLAYWRDKFDWRAQETRLNQLAHHKIDGIHFVHQRGAGPDPFPLVLTHGWPSSFTEFEKLIPLLTHPADPRDAFDVVVPSVPGHGLSDPPAAAGEMTAASIANRFARLMTDELGYRRFGAVGGDIGSLITARLGAEHPDQVVGIHVDPVSVSHYRPQNPTDLSPDEQRFLKGNPQWTGEETGYIQFQATKPATLALGLLDSPAGLAGYVLEKFHSWSGGHRYDLDELLTNLTLYWTTGTIGSSFMFYYELRHDSVSKPFPGVKVPTAVAVWPGGYPEIMLPVPPPEYVRRSFHLQRYTTMPSGAHFYARDEPQLLAADLQSFFRPLRSH
ncbi:epoxide hydrolase [Fodinicola feengrottensis]|uniref:Epoxide hydrolase n=1 Tax=Fodinicola feengrottensis TaxID=435914 RepID=A0ABN2HD14_9ACTN